MTGDELRAFRFLYLGRMEGGVSRARLARLLGFSDDKIRRWEESYKVPNGIALACQALWFNEVYRSDSWRRAVDVSVDRVSR